MDEKNKLRTNQILSMDDINVIVANKLKGLNGYGLQKAIKILEGIYRLKERKAADIKIFDKMAELSCVLKEYKSKRKGGQQQFLGL